MATLAPNLPQSSDPEYLRYSKPITGVEGSKAGYYSSKGLGDAIQTGADIGEKVASHAIEQDAYEKGQKLEDEKKADIEPIWRALKGLDTNNVPSSENENSQLSSFQPVEIDGSGSLIQGDKELPPEIKFGVKSAASMNER